MKKTTAPLFLSASIAFLTSYSTIAIADPVANTAIARGTLNGVVDKNYPNSKLSKAQIMMAILAANPRAFKGGNINFMLRNKQLSLPAEDMIAAIPEANAATLLAKHNRFYQQGKTGNLTPPTFINTGNKVALEKLKVKHSAQSEQVEALSEESTKLQGLVSRLEAEKEQRDQDLQALEDKIQALKDSGSGATGISMSGDGSASEQILRDKNDALQQQLIESKSELAENNRTTIALERRLGEVQEQNSPVSNDTGEVVEENIVAPSMDVIDAPATDLNGNIVSPEQNQSSGFDFSKFTWLLPLLPLLAILVGVGLLLKRLFGRKKHADLNLDEVDDYDFTTPKMTNEHRSDEFLMGESEEASIEAPLEVSIKIDVARAYMEAEDNQSAYEMLHEVLRDGNEAQQAEANELLAKL